MARSEVEATLARVHRDVEQAMGQLCMALVQRKCKAGDVLRWADVLKQAARELEGLAKQLRSRSDVQ